MSALMERRNMMKNLTDTVFWVLVDVNLMALFAPGTNCLRIKKIVNFCTRIKIFALLPLLTI
jgi:hypothetical protein